MMKISVIVPVYNVEKYLEKCLNSLVRQTLADLEILAIDDGSTDGSPAILNTFQQQYPQKIKVFSKPNGGLSDARNFGLERAQGEYIAFVDSDDAVSEHMFAEMHALAEKHKADLVICNLQKVDDEGRVLRELPQLPHLPEKISLAEHLSVFSDLSYFACNKIFRGSLFGNRKFRVGMHFEDIELIPQLLLDCEVIAKTDAFHYHYLEREHSISKTHTEKGLHILEAVNRVSQTFLRSRYRKQQWALEGFQILEGVYTYLAYLAHVKDGTLFDKMFKAFEGFVKDNQISLWDILKYRRFDKNYLLTLPYRKIIYYLLCFSGQKAVLKKIL